MKRRIDEAFDALNSALAVNFNTTAVRKGKTVRSAEKNLRI
jgi:D-alanyl-D-alanine carboxypeptidase/D-alanyl-D-alanine-endopeptidase (penicillin-binding protein 4)